MIESLLIKDKAKTHDKYEFKSACFNNDITISYIPEGLTSILQPLNSSINKPFKDSLIMNILNITLKKD